MKPRTKTRMKWPDSCIDLFPLIINHYLFQIRRYCEEPILAGSYARQLASYVFVMNPWLRG
jgi:hypothetical protein